MKHTHGQDHDSDMPLEDALVMGKLMEVDWTNKTARLERFRERSVKLRFGKELDEDMRRFATQFVQIEGKGRLISPEIERWAVVNVESISLPYDGSKVKVFRNAEWEKELPKSPFESNEELEDFIQVIREGRHV